MKVQQFMQLCDIRDKLWIEARRKSPDRDKLQEYTRVLHHFITTLPRERRTWSTKIDLVLNPRALWIGAHYSAHNKRLCISPLPMVTIAITFAGGIRP